MAWVSWTRRVNIFVRGQHIDTASLPLYENDVKLGPNKHKSTDTERYGRDVTWRDVMWKDL